VEAGEREDGGIETATERKFGLRVPPLMGAPVCGTGDSRARAVKGTLRLREGGGEGGPLLLGLSVQRKN